MISPKISSMALILLVCVLGIESWSNIVDTPELDRLRHFDCRRTGQDCKNGGDCYWDGYCYCPDLYDSQEYFGYDCGINVTGFPNDDKVYEGCPCYNTPYCYKGADGVSLFCACHPDFFGEFCSKNRVAVDCHSDGMKVAFHPIRPFNGIAYLGDSSDLDECTLVDDGYEESSLTRYFNHNHPECNLTVSNHTIDDQTNITYTRRLTIQYDPLIQSSFDLIIDVSCVHLDNGSWVTSESFGVERGDITKGRDVQGIYFPVKIEFRDLTSENLISDTVYLGDRIKIVIALTPTDEYGAIYVDQCTFSNSIGDKSIKAIEDSCPTKESYRMNLERHYYHSGNTRHDGIDYPFRAFRFGSDPVVKVSCRVRMCKMNDINGCRLRDCDDDKRKKREATGRGERQTRVPDDEGTIYNTFTVIDPPKEKGQGNGMSSQVCKVTSDECFGEPVVKSLGISMIVVLVVLVFVCIVLAICVCRMNFARKELALKLLYSNNQLGGVSNDSFGINNRFSLNSKGM